MSKERHEDQGSAQGSAQGWLDVAERGSILGIKFFVYLVTFFGRGPGRAVLSVVMLYYALFARGARRASQDYLQRVGAPSGLWSVYQHLLCFGRCTLDRVFLARGKTAGFRLERHGTEHLRALQARGQGAILLGAHLGSFEALRAKASEESFAINVVVNNANAQKINAALEALDPGTRVRMIDLGEGGLDFILKIRERIEAGELVAIMGDRVGKDQDPARVAEVDFLGAPARFPTGAYLIAAVLGCPVFLTFGLYMGGRGYAFFCEPFAERIVLKRGARQEGLRDCAQRYASRLAHYARLAPYNWFNFYDFWSAS